MHSRPPIARLLRSASAYLCVCMRKHGVSWPQTHGSKDSARAWLLVALFIVGGVPALLSMAMGAVHPCTGLCARQYLVYVRQTYKHCVEQLLRCLRWWPGMSCMLMWWMRCCPQACPQCVHPHAEQLHSGCRMPASCYVWQVHGLLTSTDHLTVCLRAAAGRRACQNGAVIKLCMLPWLLRQS
jgi:hypothetical protein